MDTLIKALNDTVATLYGSGNTAGYLAFSWAPWMTNVVVGLVIAVVGFVIGSLKFFKEQQLRVYEEVLPIVLKAIYAPEKKDEEEFNAGLAKAWIYFSRKVALQFEIVLSRMVDPSRGSVGSATKDLIVAMRKDVQPVIWRWGKRKLDKKDFAHTYAKLGR